MGSGESRNDGVCGRCGKGPEGSVGGSTGSPPTDSRVQPKGLSRCTDCGRAGLFAVLDDGSGGFQCGDFGGTVTGLGKNFVGLGTKERCGAAHTRRRSRKLRHNTQVIGHSHTGMFAAHNKAGLSHAGVVVVVGNGEVLDCAYAHLVEGVYPALARARDEYRRESLGQGAIVGQPGPDVAEAFVGGKVGELREGGQRGPVGVAGAVDAQPAVVGLVQTRQGG